MSDYILNGQSYGSVAAALMAHNFDPSALRPWIGTDGRHYLTANQGGKPVAVPAPVANATLRKDEWQLLDTAVVTAAKERLRVVADLRSAGLEFNIPNGLGKTVLQTETVGDITGARISMDPAVLGEADRPKYDIVNLPLPVIHKDFYFSARQIATSRNLGASLDTTMAELAARRVAEEAEKLVLGTANTFTYGGGTIYGFKNFPNRITQTLTNPTSSNWTPATLVREVLAMRQKSINRFHYGPWVLYNSPKWDQYLDDDYSPNKGDNTLRQRLQAINGIQDVRTADFLGDTWDLFLVQMTSDVVRMVVGMDITTVQWETMGGMQVHFKVMAILVPQLRADANGNTGIVHGSVV
jgi:uncharacterized linocin/CFP29 family protein